MMGRFEKFISHNKYLILCFFIPVLILSIVLVQFGMWPFGKESISMVDMKGQYLDYYAAYRNVFFSDSSLFYSWSKSMGGNFFGLYANYLASPFSVIILIFPSKYIMEAIMAMHVIKIGCAGLSFGLLIRYLFKKEDLMLVCFSVFYALMSYPIMYMMNIMWIDGLIWLPMIIMGVERLINGQKFLFYIIFLTIMLVSNYYMGYMVGIFTGIYFIFRIIESCHGTSIKVWRKKIGQFFISTSIAIGLSMWLILPTYFALLQGKGSNGFILPSFGWNMQLYPFLSKVLVGSYDSITNSGCINIYCGILVVILLFEYFYNKEIALREKVLSGSVLLLLIISAFINITDIAWHMFKSPTWFPYRYSYVICFFMLIIAYRGWIKIQSSDIYNRLLTGFLLALMIWALSKAGLSHISKQTVLINLIVAFAYLGILSLYSIKPKLLKGVYMMLLCFTIGETYYNTKIIVDSLDDEFDFQEKKIYSEFIEENRPIVKRLQKDDSAVYRIEKTYERSKNDPFTLDYMGLAHYSSMYDQNINTFLKNLGYAQQHLWSVNTGSTIVTDSLFSVKYLLTDNTDLPYNQINLKEAEDSNIKVFKNPYSLELGFRVEDEILKMQLEEYNPIENQNRILKAMLEANNDYFVPINDFTVKTHNIITISSEEIFRYTKENKNEEGFITFTFKAPGNRPLYAAFPTAYNDACTYYINGQYAGGMFGSEDATNVYIGQFDEGDAVEFKLKLEGENLTYSKHQFYSFENNHFMAAIDTLKDESLQINEFSSTYLSGTINAKDSGILFTSIPYDEGWRIKLDGKSIKPVKVMDTFIGVELEEGVHNVQMRFIPKGLIPGGIITLITIGFLLIAYMRQKKLINARRNKES